MALAGLVPGETWPQMDSAWAACGQHYRRGTGRAPSQCGARDGGGGGGPRLVSSVRQTPESLTQFDSEPTVKPESSRGHVHGEGLAAKRKRWLLPANRPN